ncbi:MAG TPA: Ig-like domain-containing protein [Gemmatimonadaceae bacterium]|nr:Ig-like domain-containing protein [Gemmatimonadaceae bacterium]
MRSPPPTWMLRAVAAVTAVAVIGCNSDEVVHSGTPVASVQVAPPKASVVVGATVTLTASAFDASGNVLTGRKVFWVVADSNFATVSSTGVVTGRVVGTVPVAASVEGHSAVAEIQILPVPVVAVRVSPSSRDLTVGQTSQLIAEPLDAQGNVLSGRSVAWSSGRPSVATVSATGLVTAILPGNAIITATVEGKSGVGAITVSPAPVASVAVSPTSATLIVGQTVQLEAQPRDGSGRPLDGRTVTWSTNRPDVATVTSTGIVAGISPGTATITASSEGRSGTATIVVEAPTIGRVEVAPTTATIKVGGSFRLTATVYDSRGDVVPGAKVGWASSNLGVAIVDNTGRVFGLDDGTVVITATSGDKAGTASVRVRR